MCKKDNQREAKLAYIAGLIDGEGTIRMSKSREKPNWNFKYMPYISFVNTNIEVINLVGKFLNAPKFVHTQSKTGFKQNKICYRVQKSGPKSIIKPIKLLLPYLRIKKLQAKLVLKYCEEYDPTAKEGKYVAKKELKFRDFIYKQIKALNCYKAPATTERRDTYIL